MTDCRVMETRTCPAGPCHGPCARFESDDPAPWSRADYRCGRCGHTFTATTKDDYVRARQLHAGAHDVASVLLTSPEIRAQVLRILGLTD